MVDKMKQAICVAAVAALGFCTFCGGAFAECDDNGFCRLSGADAPELELDRLPAGSKLVRGGCVTPDGRYAYLVHMIGRFWLPVTMVERGWCHNSAMSVFDGKTGRYLNTVLLDDMNLGAAEPWAVIADGETIAVAHSGSSEISVIDRRKFEERLEARIGEDLSTDLGFMTGVRTRIPTPKQGPRALRFEDGKPVVTEYLEDKKGITEGELVFNDARRCLQHWQSCATCHPDGFSDGFEWTFPCDGAIGKAAKSCDLHDSKIERGQLLKDMIADFGADLFVAPDREAAPKLVDYLFSLRKSDPWYKFW